MVGRREGRQEQRTMSSEQGSRAYSFLVLDLGVPALRSGSS